MNNTTVSTAIDKSTDNVRDINIGYTTFISIVCFLAVFGNAGTIIAFLQVRGLREKPSDLLVFSLCITDFFIGFVALPLVSPLYTIGYWPLGERICKFDVLFSSLVVNTSLFTLLAISIDRVLLVSLNYSSYVKIQSRRRVIGIILLCWFVSFVSVSIEWGLWNYSKKINIIAASIPFEFLCLSPSRRIQAFSTAYFIVFILTPVILVAICSVLFLILLHRRLNRNKRRVGPAAASRSTANVVSAQPTLSTASDNSATSTSASTNDFESGTRNRYIKPAITLFALVSAMVVSMFPYCCYVIIVEGFCQKCKNTNVLYGVLILQFCNGCLDPFLYGITQSKIRSFYRAKIKSIFRIWSTAVLWFISRQTTRLLVVNVSRQSRRDQLSK